MKENLKTLLVAFSIILNLVFIGTTAFYKMSSYAATGRTPEANCPFLYQKLDLSSDQLARTESVRDRFHERLRRLGGEIQTKQLELIDLLAAPEIDRTALDAVRERINQLQKTMQDTIISHIVEETGIFTPEQRKSFFRLIRERIDQSSESCPPWMRGHK